MADEPDTDTDTDTEPAEQLGDAGKKALDAERASARSAEKARKAAEARAAELEERFAQLEEGQKSEHEKALEQARKEAGDAATKEATARANARILRAEVKAAAGGKLADPDDAVRLLDLDQFEVDEHGDPDAGAIAKALDDLGKEKPYLLANGRKPAGDADQGARGSSDGASNAEPGRGRLRAAPMLTVITPDTGDMGCGTPSVSTAR
ncbi:MAG: hypothetical protein M3378_11955 [Actinomycetota bacterium]|nr:hypothetical protein [Actinomycetota bacterium]